MLTIHKYSRPARAEMELERARAWPGGLGRSGCRRTAVVIYINANLISSWRFLVGRRSFWPAADRMEGQAKRMSSRLTERARQLLRPARHVCPSARAPEHQSKRAPAGWLQCRQSGNATTMLAYNRCWPPATDDDAPEVGQQTSSLSVVSRLCQTSRWIPEQNVCNMINCHKLLMSLVIEYGRRNWASSELTQGQPVGRAASVKYNICSIGLTRRPLSLLAMAVDGVPT